MFNDFEPRRSHKVRPKIGHGHFDLEEFGHRQFDRVKYILGHFYLDIDVISSFFFVFIPPLSILEKNIS